MVAGKTSEAAAPLANTTGADAANYPKLQPTESTAVRFDVSPPLRDMVPLPVTQTKAGDLQEGGPNGDPTRQAVLPIRLSAVWSRAS